MSESQKEASLQMERMVEHYLENCTTVQNKLNLYNNAPELEIRFGTNPKQAKPISKVDYLQVVSVLYANGWKPSDDNPNGKQFLRIIPEELVMNQNFIEEQESKEERKNDGQDDDEHEKKPEQEKKDTEQDDDDEDNFMDGGSNKKQPNKRPVHRTRIRSSKIRAEIFDTFWIQRYCSHNNLVKLKDEMLETMRKNNVKSKHKQIKFTEKTGVKQDESSYFSKVQFPDFNFGIAYQIEKDYSVHSKDTRIQKIYNDWTSGKKIFRSINRVRFENPGVPMFVDLSIVKTNRKYQKNKQDKYSNRPLPKETIQEADVFNNPPIYEIEIELDNDAMKNYKGNVKALLKLMKSTIRLILIGLQGTPYPVSYSVQDSILQEYMVAMHGESWLSHKRPRTYFVGPNSVALQIEHICEPDEQSHKEYLNSVESIQQNYSVTEKADGERCILYIAGDGKVYMISRTLKVIFTGSQTKAKSCFHSIVDGEFILYGKNRTRLFQFSAFDIYFIGGRKEGERNIRALPFMRANPELLETRYQMLKEFQSQFVLESVTKGSKCDFRFQVKTFLYSTPSTSIFQASRDIWDRRTTYPYEIDGLIFTPISYGVGGSKPGQCSELGYNLTWNRSFKWKPPEFNTIDFLVVTEKDKQNRDLVRTYVKGKQVVQYKTLYLMVGLDTRQTRFMNPFDELIYDKLPCEGGSEKNHDHYQVKPFIPTVPYNPRSYVCYIPLVDDGKGLQMQTEEGEYFDENMIVEFKYNMSKIDYDHPWKWEPLRIRHDKTQSLLEGKKSMNVFKNANDVWKTIHYPIRDTMITGREPPVSTVEAVEVYYNAADVDKSQSKTSAMRDFHNLYVKSKLIIGTSQHLQKQPNQKHPLLIDFAVGKCGDLSKWSRANLKFVMGIDYSNDNIHNSTNGACVRFLQHRCNHRKDIMRGLFVEGNSQLNIRTKSEAIAKPFDKDLVQYAFGQKNLPNGNKLAFEYGVAKNGFTISSCQFAIHYFFETLSTLHSFLQNVAECTQLNGYFVGTCFDGSTLFEQLKPMAKFEEYSVKIGDQTIFSVEKQYNMSIEELPVDETSVGKPINVFLESIGQPIIEYLVQFEYLVRLMENYGFQLVEKDEAKSMGFPDGSGRFDLMFKMMQQEQKKAEMAGEKELFTREAIYMSPEEKAVSFLYRYFIFKKVRELSSETIKAMQKNIYKVDETSPVYATYSPSTPSQSNENDNDKEDNRKTQVADATVVADATIASNDAQSQPPKIEKPLAKMKKVKGRKFQM